MRTLSGSGRAAMWPLSHERYRVGSPRGSRAYRPIYGASPHKPPTPFTRISRRIQLSY
ncbi:hypothetical protein DSO57_1037336, partial [Entomophthora muscae]